METQILKFIMVILLKKKHKLIQKTKTLKKLSKLIKVTNKMNKIIIKK